MFGKRLQEVLDLNDMRQKELALTLGVSVVTVNRWIQSVYEPDLDMITRISKLFNVSVDFLIGRDDEMYSYSKSKRLRFFNEILVSCGYLKENETVTNEEIDLILKFITVNKEYIKSKIKQ